MSILSVVGEDTVYKKVCHSGAMKVDLHKRPTNDPLREMPLVVGSSFTTYHQLVTQAVAFESPIKPVDPFFRSMYLHSCR